MIIKLAYTVNRLTISIQVLADHLLPVIIQLIYGFSHVLREVFRPPKGITLPLVVDVAADGHLHMLREGEV